MMLMLTHLHYSSDIPCCSSATEISLNNILLTTNMKFQKHFTEEQRELLHEVIHGGLTYSDKTSYTFTSQGAFKKKPGLIDITLDNFFETEDLNNFRCLDTFCDNVVWLDYIDFEPFYKLFELMNNGVSFDVSAFLPGEIIEVFIPYEGKDEPEYMNMVYLPAFYDFLKSYTNGEINVKVTADELIKRICDFTGYDEEMFEEV